MSWGKKEREQTYSYVLVVAVLLVCHHWGQGVDVLQPGLYVDLRHVLNLPLSSRLEDLCKVAW